MSFDKQDQQQHYGQRLFERRGNPPDSAVLIPQLELMTETSRHNCIPTSFSQAPFPSKDVTRDWELLTGINKRC
jgi:hypothetical protein